MEKEILSIKENIYKNGEFTVSICDNDANILFPTDIVCGFFTDGNKIFVMIDDVISQYNIEEELDKLMKGFWLFKKRVTITLSKMDSFFNKVYCVKYTDCRLDRYYGNRLTYNGKKPLHWHLVFTYGNKEIIKSANYEYGENNIQSLSPKITTETIEQKSIFPKKVDSVTEEYQDWEEATMNKKYDEFLHGFDNKAIEKTIKKTISDIENKL